MLVKVRAAWYIARRIKNASQLEQSCPELDAKPFRDDIKATERYDSVTGGYQTHKEVIFDDVLYTGHVALPLTIWSVTVVLLSKSCGSTD